MSQTNTTRNLRLYGELIYIALAALLYGIIVWPFRSFITQDFHIFFAVGTLIIVQYFRIVVNERSVFWVRPFFVKLPLGIFNAGFFFLALNRFMTYIDQFEDYNYTGVGMLVQDIYPGLAAGTYSYLRSATFFVGVAGLMLIILLEMRLIYSVFKYREVPGLGDQ